MLANFDLVATTGAFIILAAFIWLPRSFDESQTQPQATWEGIDVPQGVSEPLTAPVTGRVQEISFDQLSDEAFDCLVTLGKSSSRVSHKVQLRATGAIYVRKSMTPREVPVRDIIKELKPMTEVRHPNIVMFFSVYPIHRGGYAEVGLIMEFCEGGNLGLVREAMKKRAAVVGENVVGRITEGILQGLAHLHGMKILHRDIKPSNILFSRQGVAKLSEFMVAGESVGAFGDTFMDSLVYTAPERISGKGYSRGGDIWSMGISLIEFVHKECPYRATLRPIDMLLRIHSEEPPRLKDLDGVVWSEDMKNFFETVLRVDPETRPDTQALLGHPWITSIMKQEVAMERWMRQVWGWPKQNVNVQAGEPDGEDWHLLVFQRDVV